jgi:arylsulfatase A-like enzyme
VELYDLQADPGELHDLAADEPATAKQMLDELQAARAEADQPFTASNTDH